MIFLVTGGSGSGKSAWAENLAVTVGSGRRIYLAAMKPWDEECEKTIARHRRMRAGKGFETIERYKNLKDLILQGERCGVLLLECMSNLLANEMFGTGEEDTAETADEEEIIREIEEGVENLASQTDHLVIVTNEIFSDGIKYQEDTVRYIRLLGLVNQKLGQAAGYVAEVNCKIPLIVKNTGLW